MVHPMRGSALLRWLAALPAEGRDGAVAAFLDERGPRVDAASPGRDLVGFLPSSAAQVVRAVVDLPVTADDVFVDLGSGLGTPAILAHLLTGARAVGIEVQPGLCALANERARRLGLDRVSFQFADARDAPLDEGTVFYLYAPFTGAVLDTVLARLHGVARRHAIRICAVGIDLPPCAWLEPRESPSAWLSLHDSRVPGVPARPPARSPLLDDAKELGTGF